jgi:hypothetical protein
LVRLGWAEWLKKTGKRQVFPILWVGEWMISPSKEEEN